jgi:hypothetical protein
MKPIVPEGLVNQAVMELVYKEIRRQERLEKMADDKYMELPATALLLTTGRLGMIAAAMARSDTDLADFYIIELVALLLRYLEQEKRSR